MEKRVLSILIGLSLILLAGCGQDEKPVYSGIIEGVEVPIVTEIGGQIAQLPVEEGQTVKKGDVLAILDQQIYKEQLKEAEAAVEVAQAAIDEAKAGAREQELSKAIYQIEQNQAQIDYLKVQEAKMEEGILQREAMIAQTQSQLEGAQSTLDYQRKKLQDLTKLYQEGAVSHDQLEAQREAVKQAETAVEGLQSQIKSLEAQKMMALRDKESISSQIRQALAQKKAAEANLDLLKEGVTSYQLKQLMAQKKIAEAKLNQSRIQLSKTIITSPVNGVVIRRNISLGETVKPAYQIMTLLEENRLEVHVYVPEAQLNRVRPGKEALIFVDAYPGETFRGKVKHIAEKAEFTPKNVQTSEERTKMVFRVTIQVEDGWGKLKPGMPADVEFPEGESP